jgi:hypothetical protein
MIPVEVKIRRGALEAFERALRIQATRESEILARRIGQYDFADTLRQYADALAHESEPLACEVPLRERRLYGLNVPL